MSGINEGWTASIASPMASPVMPMMKPVQDQTPVSRLRFSKETVAKLDDALRAVFAEALAQPIGLQTMGLVERLAAAARSMMSLVTADEAATAVASVNDAYAAQFSPMSTYGYSMNTLTPAPRSETFGATVLREIMGVAKSIHRDPAKLVEAAAIARERGLTQLADKLEAEVMSTLTTPGETAAVAPVKALPVAEVRDIRSRRKKAK